MKYKTIGLLGGLGPEATADVLEHIIKLTPHDEDNFSDQEHLPVIMFNIPQIPSRVKAILHNGKSPVKMLKEYAIKLEQAGADFIIIPCNTVSYYIPKIREVVNIPIIDIVEETVNYIQTKHPQIKKIGLMATEANLRTGVYQKKLLEKDLEIVNVPNYEKTVRRAIKKIRDRYYNKLHLYPKEKKIEISTVKQLSSKQPLLSIVMLRLKSLRGKVTKAIFGKQGIKAGHHSRPSRLLESAAHELKKNGAEAVIMGCSEIPLALHQKNVKVKLVNPNEILAQVAIDIAKGNRELK